MNKSKRLVDLIIVINRKQSFTAKDLAEEFGVSIRTIQRDLKDLEDLGVPLYTELGPKGGYRLLNKKILPPIAFTENEAIAIFFAYQSLQNYASLPFDDDAISALSKFYNYLPDNTKDKIDVMRNRVLFWVPKRDEDNPYLKFILEGVIERKILSIEYESINGVSYRDILPIGIYSHNGYWYCPAFCLNKQSYRLFRVDYIRSVTIKKDSTLEKPIGDISLKDWFEPSRPEKTVKLKVKLSKKGVRKCQLEPWLDKKIIINYDGTGFIDTAIDIRDVDYYSDFLLGVGTDATIESPCEIVDLILEKIDNIKNNYKSNPI
ncbi:YafY family transcriptional regulator [Clostridium sp. MSJ-4]|uniref:YafY family transcriptional regulator n=1 Tax=Clostridium simiarum TaxID=2841506 RepID=A0ABS6F085_9CLOT|nr:YafY family protein [Clostridium simiarum]MBU5591648.1 YafY family transcriptional regulator [Clostridium simiarum]